MSGSRRATATPPPSGMCTSSSTTSGCAASISATASSTVAGLADDLDAALELAAHARAEQRVVVDQHDAPHRDSSTSVPPPGCERDLGVPAMALHPADDRLAHAAAIGRHGVGVEARAAIADEHLGPLVGHLRVDVDPPRARELRRVEDRLARRGGERPACRRPARGRRRRRPRPRRRGRSSISVAARTSAPCERVGRRGLVGVEPRAQLALLAARELRDLARDRRRGAGSARASAGPSRAGAPRPRRAPARGCAPSARPSAPAPSAATTARTASRCRRAARSPGRRTTAPG